MANETDSWDSMIKRIKHRDKQLNSNEFFEALKSFFEAWDINCVYKERKTLLYHAVIYDDVELTNWLLNRGANPNVKDITGKTVIETANNLGNFKIKKLIENFQPLKAIRQELIHWIDCNRLLTWQLQLHQKVENKKIIILKNCSKIESLLNDVQFYKSLNTNASCFFVIVQTTRPIERITPILELQEYIDTKRPLIILLESTRDNNFKIYYKDSYSDTLKPMETPRRIANQGNLPIFETDFSFELILQALKSETYGKFEDVMLNIKLDPSKFLSHYGKNDNAKKESSILGIRFLGIFDEGLHPTQSNLEAAARDGFFESFTSLLDLPFSYTSGMFHFTCDVIMNTESRYNLLEISAWNRNAGALKFLLNCGFDINQYSDRQVQNLSDLAWKGRHCDFFALLAILEADGCFPKNFASTFTDLNLNIGLIKDVIEFHDNIQKGLLSKVKEFVSKYRSLKHAYLPTNESALFTALTAKKFEIYAFLRSKHFLPRWNENLEDMKMKLNPFDQDMLGIVQKKYFNFNKLDNYYLIQLCISSRLGFDVKESEEDELFEIIKEAYEHLDNITLMTPILKTIANARFLQIIFDFNNYSVNDLVPRKSKCVSGTTYTNGYIYIGAKGLLERNLRVQVLGTLAHEMTHYAMKLVYDNDCKPYRLKDTNKKSVFYNVIEECDKIYFEEIIDKVKKYENKEHIEAELIVRVPQTLVCYWDNKIRFLDVKDKYPQLFKFYAGSTNVDLSNHYPKMKALDLIQDVNSKFDIILKVQSLKFRNNLRLIDIDARNNMLIHESNCTIVTLSRIRQSFIKVFKKTGDCYHMFAMVQFFGCPTYKNEIIEAYNSHLYPTLIIDCTGFKKYAESFQKFIKELKPTNRVIFVKEKNCKVFPFQSASQSPNSDNSFEDFAPECKQKLLNNKLKFQDNYIELYKLVNVSSKVLEHIPLNEFFSGNLKAVESIPYLNPDDQSFYYVERKFRKFEDSTFKNPNDSLNSDNLEYLDINTEELIKEAAKHNIVIIADDPGTGKTMTLKMIAKRLNILQPLNWQVLLNFAQLVQVLIKDFDPNSDLDIENFMVEKILKLDDNFRRALFTELFKKGMVTIFCDGLDEICSRFKNFASYFLQMIHKRTDNQLWITSRPNAGIDFEVLLHTKSVKLIPFSKQEQREFLTNYFELQHVAERVQKISEKMNVTIVQVPLQLKILADLYKEEEQELESETLANSAYQLYNKFVRKMLNLWMGRNVLAVDKNFDCSQEPVTIVRVHQTWAKLNLLDEQSVKEMGLDKLGSKYKHELFGVGLTEDCGEGLVKFIHETYSEYFCADYIMTNIFNVFAEIHRKPMRIFIKVLFEKKYLVVRMFLDSALSTYSLEENSNLEDCKTYFIQFVEKNYSILHNSAREGHCNILKNVLHFLEEAKDFAKNVLNSEDESGRNILLLSIFYRLDVKFIESLLKMSSSSFANKSKLKKYLMKRDKFKFNVFHTTIASKSLVVLEALWTFVENCFGVKERKKFFLSENAGGKNMLSLAVGTNDLEVIGKIFRIGKDLMCKKFRSFLIKNTDKHDCTILHDAAAHGTKQTFDFVWLELEKQFDDDQSDDELKKFLLETDNLGRNPLIAAFTVNEKCEVNQKMWEIYRNVIDDKSFKKLLTQEMAQKKTLLHMISENNNLEVLKLFLNYCQDLFCDEKMNKLIKKEDSDKRTAFALAAACNKDENVLLELWSVCVQYRGKENMKEVLSSTDSFKNTPLHLVCSFNTVKCLKLLLKLTKNTLTFEEQHALIRKECEQGRTVLLSAAASNPDQSVITKIWTYYQKLLKKLGVDQELRVLKHFATQQDSTGASAFDLSALYNNKEVLSGVWSFIVETHSQVELQKVLTRTDKQRRNIVFRALIYNDKKDVVEFLWSLAKILLDSKSSVEFLSAHNKFGGQAIALAYNSSDSDALTFSEYWQMIQVNFARDLQKEVNENGQFRLTLKLLGATADTIYTLLKILRGGK